MLRSQYQNILRKNALHLLAGIDDVLPEDIRNIDDSDAPAASAGFQRLLGYNPNAPEGDSPYSLFPPILRDAEGAVFRAPIIRKVMAALRGYQC